MNQVEIFENIKGIYLGDRGISFKRLIISLLKKGNISQKYIDILTDDDSMEIYGSAFTSEQIDEINNYQVYEQLGDLTGNKFIVWYIYQRFPQLKCVEGVKVAARLRINLGSKNSFYSIAEKYGFWDYISATNNLRLRKKKPLLEDVFEAFLGATEYILDTKTDTIGKGYECVYKILKNIFDDIEISLKYEDLYDPKTRLKELFDIHTDKLGSIKYEEERNEKKLIKSYIYRIDDKGSKILLGSGSASLKADSEQVASLEALKNLENKGYNKAIPNIYKTFSDNIKIKTEDKDIINIIQKKENINNIYPVKSKSKYQNLYSSTILSSYCRRKDFNAIKKVLKMGADPNIKDTDGLSSLDALLIGNYKEEFTYIIIKRFLKNVEKLDINRNVYEKYFKKYLESENYSSFFKKVSKNFNILD